MTSALARSTENMVSASAGSRGRLVLRVAWLLAVGCAGANELSVCLMDFLCAVLHLVCTCISIAIDALFVSKSVMSPVIRFCRIEVLVVICFVVCLISKLGIDLSP